MKRRGETMNDRIRVCSRPAFVSTFATGTAVVIDFDVADVTDVPIVATVAVAVANNASTLPFSFLPCLLLPLRCNRPRCGCMFCSITESSKC